MALENQIALPKDFSDSREIRLYVKRLARVDDTIWSGFYRLLDQKREELKNNPSVGTELSDTQLRMLALKGSAFVFNGDLDIAYNCIKGSEIDDAPSTIIKDLIKKVHDFSNADIDYSFVRHPRNKEEFEANCLHFGLKKFHSHSFISYTGKEEVLSLYANTDKGYLLCANGKRSLNFEYGFLFPRPIDYKKGEKLFYLEDYLVWKLSKGGDIQMIKDEKGRMKARACSVGTDIFYRLKQLEAAGFEPQKLWEFITKDSPFWKKGIFDNYNLFYLFDNQEYEKYGNEEIEELKQKYVQEFPNDVKYMIGISR